ncbi:hypothetical protein D3C81_1525430 [compost metagenome]
MTAVRFSPHSLELTRGFDQQIRDAQGLQALNQQVYCMPGCDAVEVHLHRRILAQLLTHYAQMPMPDTLAGAGQRLFAGYLFHSRLRTEAPQIEQRLHGQVKRAITLLRQLLTNAHQLQHISRHGLTAVGGQAIERLGQRIAAIGGEALVDALKDSFHLTLDLLRRRPLRRAYILHGVTAAHGRPADTLKRVALSTAQQTHQHTHQ